MLKRTMIALACAVGLAGCANRLEPAPVANEVPVPGAADGAVVRASGVQMVAKAGAWSGTPTGLDRRLTPMLVTITNSSKVPLSVHYDELMLVTPKGMVYKALPPFQIEGKAPHQAQIVPEYPPQRFGYAPYLSPYFAGPKAYLPFPMDAPYWARYAQVMTKVKLPTLDMLRKALPEGVLEPGGKVQGFVYFPGVGDDIDRVRLRAEFMNAQSGQQLVTLSIPFLVG